jgi:WD40 repeat protein
VRRPADEYDAVLIAPTKNLLSMDRPLSAWFVSRMYSDRAFARVIALRSPASGDDDVTFIPSIYSAEISWNSSPSLSARAADAAQKILASPVVKRESASAESASDQEQVAPQAAPDTVEEVQTVYTPRGFSSAELPHEDRLSYAAFAPLGNFMLTTSRDCTARLWNAENGQRRQVVFRHENTVTHADFDPHGRYLVTGGRDAAVKLWDVYTGQSLAVLLGHTAPVVHVAFNPRGSRFVSSGDLSARIWHVGSHSLVAQMRHEAQIVRAEFSPRAESLLTCSHDQTARLWDATTGLPIGEEMRHARAVNYATFSPDGNLVATASEDKTAVLWSAYAGHPVGKIFRHQAPIRRVAFSPDGSMLATASGDGTAALWNVSDGRRLATRQHGGAVNCVTFSPDGLRLATACVDGLVREWSLQDGQLLRELPVTDHAYYVAYNAKTTRLVAIDASTSGKLWAVE